MIDILTIIPDNKVVVMTSINEKTMNGLITGIKAAGKWNPGKWLLVILGCDDFVREFMFMPPELS